MSKSLSELFGSNSFDNQFNRETSMFAPNGSSWDEWDERFSDEEEEL